METVVLALSVVAMIPFVTAGFVALAIAAMPVMVVVLSFVEARATTDRPAREPFFAPVGHPAPA